MKQLILSDEVYKHLKWLYANAKTEVSALGVTKESDLLYVEKLYVPKQECTAVTTEMDANDVADWIEDMAVQGIGLERLGRVWFHTHPGMKPNPSSTDTGTFAETFGHFDHAIMVIMGEGYELKGRLWVQQWGVTVEIPIEVDNGKPNAEWTKDLEKVAKPVVISPKYGAEAWGYDNWQHHLPTKYQDAGTSSVGGTKVLTPSEIRQMPYNDVIDALQDWGYLYGEMKGLSLAEMQDMLVACECFGGSEL